MLVCSMFYTRTEIGERIGWYVRRPRQLLNSCVTNNRLNSSITEILSYSPFGTELNRTFNLNGFALIVSSFLSFGVYHANPKVHPNQWQWLMVIESILTFFVFVLFYFFFPDNPTTASFLTQEEKVIAIKRVQENQNGIETKVWKRHQCVCLPSFIRARRALSSSRNWPTPVPDRLNYEYFYNLRFIEAVTDPKNWLFFLFAAISNLQNGISIQYAIIIKSFGFSTLQTTLLAIPSGAAVC